MQILFDKVLAMNDNQDQTIAIGVKTRYIEEESEPSTSRFVFAYTITIRNEGRKAAKLLKRHWIITDANGKVQEVKGEGVVGKQPDLEPGDHFTYTSGAVLETPVGTMEGSYQMKSRDGSLFDAPIAPFSLNNPQILH